MRKRIAISILSVFLIVVLFQRCNLSKHVPENHYLLWENNIELEETINIREDNLRNIIRQTPNSSVLGIRWKLKVYNSVDTVSRIPVFKHFIRPMNQKREDLNEKIRNTNSKRKARENKINNRRIERALAKGETKYRHKRIKLKDTLSPRPFFREWLKYSIGEAPRIYDSLTMDLSEQQIRLYLKRKGYFHATVGHETKFDRDKQRVVVNYIIEPGSAHYIDSMRLVSENQTVRRVYNEFLNEKRPTYDLPFQFDSDGLGRMRNDLATHMRDNGIYGFRSSYVSFEVDTLNRNNTVGLDVQVARRMVDKDGESVKKSFAVTRINNVYFHIKDTNSYEGNFRNEQLIPRNINLSSGDEVPTFDTLRYDWYKGRNPQFRGATFLYNGELKIDPRLIEHQNFLEENNFYKGYYVDRSFNHLIQLDLFQSIRPQLVENDDNTIDVHYYLTPSKHQAFSFEPRATNSNGFLGVASSVNFQHKNIFGGGEKLKLSFSGGFESQPAIFDELEDGTTVTNAGRSFNTLEYGPTAELELPGLFPFSIERLSKRQLPKTSLTLAYNFQKRDDFERDLFQFNYSWRFFDTRKTQVFTVGLPIIGGFQFINIDKSPAFQERLEQQNDLFLINAYSQQFIWKDIKLSYQYSNQEIKKKNILFSYGAIFDLAGNFASLLTRNAEPNANGNKELFNVRYSQFARLDNDFRIQHKLKGKRSLNYRVQIGAGLPYGNNGPNLPFDYSFFAGGSNDNRGFRARSLGPGDYKYYLDTNRTATEIGDIRIGGTIEYRFQISGMFRGALFSDFGNVWTYNEDANRLGGQFSTDWYRQLAVAMGTGLRIDLDFLIFRLDVGIPIRVPSLPLESQWIWQSRDALYEEAEQVLGENFKSKFLNPFTPQVHIAIGYPF